MARPLAVVAAAGIAVSVICLSLASVLSPYRRLSFPFSSAPYYRRGWWNHRPWAGGPSFTESGEIVTREFAWDGDGSLQIYIPGVVYFERGPEWQVSVKGRQSSIEHLRIEHGAILFDAPLAYPHTSSLEVRIRGPSLEEVSLNGSGMLVLQNVAQKEIAIDIRGAGSVEGSGTVENMALRIYGSGNAKLGELATEDIDAVLFGSGDAEVAPTGDAAITIFGSGDLRLRTQPKHVSSRVMGSGRVIPPQAERNESPVTAPDRTGTKPKQIST